MHHNHSHHVGGASKPDFYPVYVGNITHQVQISDLRRIFSRIGSVLEVTVISDHGFVNFASEHDARDAIKQLNGFNLHDTQLHVDFSRELANHLRLKGVRFEHTQNPLQVGRRSRSPIHQQRHPRIAPPPPREFLERIRSSRTPPRHRTPPLRTSLRERSPLRQRSPLRKRSPVRGSPPRRPYGSPTRSRTPPKRSPPRRSSHGASPRRYQPRRDSFRDSRRSSSIEQQRHSPQERRKSEDTQRDRYDSRRDSRPDESDRRDTQRDREGDRSRSPDLRSRRRRVPSAEQVVKVNLDSIKPDVELDKKIKEEEEREKVDKEPDLREVLRKRHQKPEKKKPTYTSIKVQIKSTVGEEDHDRKIVVDKDNEKSVQELFLGSLFNPEIEKEDIERLFEPYGPVLQVERHSNFAFVSIECAREKADEAINDLDKNSWMDNKIRVKYRTKPDLSKQGYKGDHDTERYLDEPRPPRQPQKVNAEMIDNFLKSQREENTEKKPVKKKDKNLKMRFLSAFCASWPRSVVEDMKEVFSRFGTVNGCTRNGPTILVQLFSTEKEAVRCIAETNKIQYKGQELKVKFADGSDEDMPAFREQYPTEFRNYPKQLIPDGFLEQASTSSQPDPVTSSSWPSSVPIGVLPPSSSLGAFGAVPDSAAVSLTNMLRTRAIALPDTSHPPPLQQQQQQQQHQQLYQQAQQDHLRQQPLPTTSHYAKEDPEYICNVDGHIHSISNRMVLISFFTGCSWRLAKFIPGQMYVNGQRSLGYIIKNNTFHTWPSNIKSFLQQGSSVRLDVKKMSMREMLEAREISSEEVMYSTPMVWKTKKPDEREVTISKTSLPCRVMKGTVVRLYPKWGVLFHPSGEIFFEVNDMFVDTAPLTRNQSLLRNLEMGDTLGVYCAPVDYLAITERARSIPCFQGRTDTIKFRAQLVWNISAEVDPYSHGRSPPDGPLGDCQFLATSSTLNSQLPNEKEAVHRGWPATIEEIHLPAGGILRLDESLGMDDARSRVYFHRSRLFVNGAKIQSNTSLSDELVPGDRVTVDVAVNLQGETPYVLSAAYWIALSVSAKTTDRGVSIAKALRMEGLDPSDQLERNVSKGRIVFFHQPDHVEGRITSGIAVIDCGDNAGQRVEFDATQCSAFGFPLGKADLSQIFRYGEEVFIQVKPYNSYCVERLWVGFSSSSYQETGLPPNDRLHMKKYLYDHGLDVQAFDSLVRGQFPKRPFIPLKGQTIKGHIKLVKEDDPTVGADRIVIEADVGEILYVEAPREYVYVFGHWMGKADLKYILENEEVYFEFHPLFDKNFSGDGVLEMPRASLVWILDEESRPRYIGQGNRPEVTERMDNMLWKFVRAKNLDVGTFRALVEGRLPPKSVGGAAPLPTTPAAQPADLDSDVLEQAKLLQQMKQSLGQSAMMQAMMLFMSSQNNTSQQSAGQMMEMMKRFMETSAAAPSNNTPPLNIATSQEQAMSSGSAVLPSASGPMGYTAPTRSHLNQSNTTASFAPKSTQDILQSVDDLLKRSRNPRQPDTRDPNLPLMQQFSKDPYWDWYESDKK